MKTSKEYRSELAAFLAQADKITAAWDGKEDQEGFEAAMKELRSVLGKADEVKTLLQMANQREGLADLIREPAATVTTGREAAPGEGQVPDAQREAISRPAYKAAMEVYLRRDIGRMGPSDVKTLSEGIDDAGGFLVPEDWRAELLKRTAARPSIRANARVIPTGRDSVRVPKVIYSADYRYTSAARMKWVGETPATSTVHRITDPVFGSELIPVHTVMASLPVTQDLLEDSVFTLDGYIQDILGEAFDLGEEEVFISGTGAGQPQGILNHALVDTASSDTNDGMKVVSGDAALLTADGLINLVMQVPEQYDFNSRWYFNKRSSESAIRKLKATTNEYLWPVTNQVGSLGPVDLELLGYPVTRTPFAPNVAANAFPIIFGDMRAYTIVDRVGLSIQRLTEVYAETNIVVFLARKRVGGKLLEPYRLKVQKVSV